MQALVAILAGVGIFTVLHMLGIGTVYKVRPDSPSHWLYIGWLTPYLLGVQPCSMHGFVDHPMSAAVHHRSLPHY